MLFLIALLSLIISTGLFEPKGKRKKKTTTPIAKPQQKYKIPTITFGPPEGGWPRDKYKETIIDFVKQGKKPTLQQVLKFFERLTPQEKATIARNLTNMVQSGTKELKEHYDKFLDSVNYAAKKMLDDKSVTDNQKRIVEIAKNILMDKTKSVTTFVPLNSSWLINCLYTRADGKLYVNMVRSKGKIYTFFKVPELAYLYIVTCKSNAGTQWWRRNYWRYSVNYGKWAGHYAKK